MTDRVTVSLDEESRTALNTVMSDTGLGQSEVTRRALTFYAANSQVASDDPTGNLEQYYQMLNSGEHVLLDVDFLHCFLDTLYEDGEPDQEFVEAADQVSDFHALEYAQRFDNLEELLDWLSLCGFLTVRHETNDVYHVVFPSEAIRWFMTRFIERSTSEAPFEVGIEQGVSKVIFTER